MAKVKEEEWAEWLLNPATQALMEFLRRSQVALQQQWAAGQFQGESHDELLTRNAAALGEHAAYERLLELTYQQIVETIDD